MANDHDHQVTGIVMSPGPFNKYDTISASSINKAMDEYLANRADGMHIESHISNADETINGHVVPAGSWLMTRKATCAEIGCNDE